jgi:hypothetical protein
MPDIKRIICLANSRKRNGRCVAGIELMDSRKVGWIRPVSARENEEVSEYERQYSDGSDPCLLDVIDVPLLHPQPDAFQQENWLLDPEKYWEKVDHFSWIGLQRLIDSTTQLWLNRYSTYNGCNDFIPLAQANSLRCSLYLIHIDRLCLSVFSPGETFGNPKRRVQGSFNYNDVRYKLWVTDPLYERFYLAMPNGTHYLAECFLTVSLGKVNDDGKCYKLIAAIMQPEGRPGT